jgi:hypothetical protein
VTQACIDCGSSDRTVMLTQEAFVLGRRVTWHVCASCWLKYEWRAEERAREPMEQPVMFKPARAAGGRR